MKKFLIAALLIVGTVILNAGAQPTGATSMASLDLPEGTQLKGIRFPKYDENNNVIFEVFCDVVTITAGNAVMQGLLVEFYDYESTNRITTMKLRTPECFYNEKKGKIVGEKDVRIERDDLVVTGTGFIFSIEAREFRILDDAKVIGQGADRALKEMD